MARAARTTAPTRTPSSRPLQGNGRSLLPGVAGRSLWLSAVWTGVAAAVVGAMVAVVAVAVLWLPAAGGSGRAGSTVRAGVITFVASLHGGVTVDGLDTAFLPLGLLLAVALVCRRAGRGLVDAALVLDETEPGRLVRAAALQAGSFAVTAAVFAAASGLGTSSASVPGALVAGFVVFVISAGTVTATAAPVASVFRAAAPVWLVPGLRIAGAVVAVELTAGSVLGAVSLVAHHHQVAQVSAQIGGGWAGLPVLLLGVLAVPNAAIAGAAYLAGPGFAVGSGTTVALGTSPHGPLPAFPVLGALPTGPAPWIVWLLAVLTPLSAGLAAAAVAKRTDLRWRSLGAGVAASALLAFVLAWQGGGSIGSARLHAIGASPWQFGFVVAGGVAASGALWLGLDRAVATLRARGRDAEPDGRLGALVATLGATVEAAATEIKIAADARNAGSSTASESDASPRREGGKGDKLAG